MNRNNDHPAVGAMIHRIMVSHTDLLSKYGPEKILAAAEREAEFIGNIEEIGSSDITAWVNNIKRDLEGHPEMESKEHNLINLEKEWDEYKNQTQVAEGTGDEYMNLQPGDYVRDASDGSGEVFIMRGRPDDRRVRIEDKDGRGWNIAPWRLVAVDPNDAAIGHYFNRVAEAKGLAKKVKIVKGPDAGKTGWIREIIHGAFKGAPKTYNIDLDDWGQANNIPGTALRLVAVDPNDAAIGHYFNRVAEDGQDPFSNKRGPYDKGAYDYFHGHGIDLNVPPPEKGMYMRGYEEARARGHHKQHESVSEGNTGHAGYDAITAVMSAVDAGQDATFDIAGEPITLEYPEARFLAGKFKAFRTVGREDEFIKYMENPATFDRLMKKLRDLIDKQKNFRGSVPGERGVEGIDVKAGVTEALGPDPELKAILDQFPDAVEGFKNGEDISDYPDFYEALFTHYSENGEMPYGTQKARDGDPINWLSGRLDDVIGVEEGIVDTIKAGAKKAFDKLGGGSDQDDIDSRLSHAGLSDPRGLEELIHRLEKKDNVTKNENKGNDNEYWCQTDNKFKPIPDGYKKLDSGYITRL